jgi:hypothetical protein
MDGYPGFITTTGYLAIQCDKFPRHGSYVRWRTERRSLFLQCGASWSLPTRFEGSTMGFNLLRNPAASGGNAKGCTCLRIRFPRSKALVDCGTMLRTGVAVATA